MKGFRARTACLAIALLAAVAAASCGEDRGLLADDDNDQCALYTGGTYDLTVDAVEAGFLQFAHREFFELMRIGFALFDLDAHPATLPSLEELFNCVEPMGCVAPVELTFPFVGDVELFGFAECRDDRFRIKVSDEALAQGLDLDLQQIDLDCTIDIIDINCWVNPYGDEAADIDCNIRFGQQAGEDCPQGVSFFRQNLLVDFSSRKTY